MKRYIRNHGERSYICLCNHKFNYPDVFFSIRSQFFISDHISNFPVINIAPNMKSGAPSPIINSPPVIDRSFSASYSSIIASHRKTADLHTFPTYTWSTKKIIGGFAVNIIEVSNLKKAYGTNNVLQGVEFQAKAGEVIGVIGKNGAGKSTFLEILMTIKQYDAGKVVVLENDIKSISTNRLEEVRKQISVVLQPTQFYKMLKVEELLKLFKSYYKSSVDIKQIMVDFKLEPYRKKYFDKLSGGWKQIVSLAIAFLSEPKLLILDEPTTGLDPHMRNILWSYITEYNNRTGGTVILTTHNMDEIELYCDKVMLINNGVNEVFDTTEGILASGYSSIHEFYLKKVSI